MHGCPVGLHMDPYASKPVCTDMNTGHPQTYHVFICTLVCAYIHVHSHV